MHTPIAARTPRSATPYVYTAWYAVLSMGVCMSGVWVMSL